MYPKSTFIYLTLFLLAGVALWQGRPTAFPVAATAVTNPIIVTAAADQLDGFDGQCTLREALHNANNNSQYSAEPGECAAGSDTLTDIILLQSGEIYVLTLDGAGDDAGSLKALSGGSAAVDLRIETIDGDLPATIQTAVNGQRVMEIQGATVELDNLILSGGNVDGPGGGILNQGVLTVANSSLQNNSARNGGGLHNQGAAVLRDSQIISNTAVINGGGLVNQAGGLLLIETSQIAHNSAGQNGGGLYNLDDLSSLTIANSAVLSNTAVNGDGGGLHTLAAATINASDFRHNQANQSVGGAIYNSSALLALQQVSFDDNRAALGGGIYNASGQINDVDGTFTANKALLAHGGAFYNGGPTAQAHFQGTLFQANEAAAGWGGAVYHNGQTFTLNHTSLRENMAERGAGLYLAAGTTLLTQSALVHNEATAVGGGIFLQSGLTMGSVTLSGNSAADNGGALYIDEDGTATAVNITLILDGPSQNLHSLGELSLQNSILSGTGDDCDLPDAPLTSLGRNLTNADAACAGLDHADDLFAADLLLAPLGAYYSEQLTHALLPDSPALNAANVAACAAAPVNGRDQRGFFRPYGVGCDIGAHEEQLPLRTYLPILVSAN